MTSNRSKNFSEAWTGGRAILNLAPAAIGAMFLLGVDVRASDLAVAGNLDVSGNADIRGNEFTLGTSGTNSAIPGITLTYADAVISGTSESSLLRFTATRAFHGWVWEHENENQTATVPMMKMDSDHVLTIYDVLGNPSVILDPSGGSNSSNVLTINSADNRYIKSEILQVNLHPYGPALAFTTGTASGANTIAGPEAKAAGFGSIAFGAGAQADGSTVAIGNNAEARGEEASAFGSGAKATANIAFSVGIAAEGRALGATAYNTNAMASGQFSTARGIGSKAFGANSTASGNSSQSDGVRSVASGPFSRSVGVESIAAGHKTVSQGMGQFVVGRFNIPQGHSSQWIPEDDLFVVGNGSVPLMSGTSVQKDSSGNTLYQPSNAFVVKKNGNTVVHGSLTLSGTADVQGSGISLGVYNAETSSAKVSMRYEASANNPALTIQAQEEGLEWVWRRAVSGTGVSAMKLDSSNRLILTGTAASNPPQLVLDPNAIDGPTSVLTQGSADQRYVVNSGTANTTLANTVITGGLTISGTATANGSALLTQTAADTRYLPAASGLTLSNGRVGIGTTTPAQLLHIRGAGARMRIDSTSGLDPVLELSGPSFTNYLFVNQADGGWYMRTDSASRNVFIQSSGVQGATSQGNVQIGGVQGNIPAPGSQLVIRGNVNSATFGLLDAQGYSGTSALFVRSDGKVGIGTAAPQAALDVSGDGKVSGNLAISGSGSLTLPDGTILSASNNLQTVVASGTALAISGTIPATQVNGLSAVATTGAYSSLTGLPTIPVDNDQLANGAGYITASGTAAFAQTSGTAAILSGTIQATQVTGLSEVATSGDYASLSGLPTIPTNTNQLVNGAGYVTASGTANGITLSGTTKVAAGGFIVTGTAVQVTSGTTTATKIVSSGSNHLVLIPEQGDLSMGSFIAGPLPE